MTKPLTSVAVMMLVEEGRLGLDDTGWVIPPDKNARVVTLHQRKNGRLAETPNPATIAAQARGDGRLFSTATDYGRFVAMILNRGQLVGPPTEPGCAPLTPRARGKQNAATSGGSPARRHPVARDRDPRRGPGGCR